jgi:hypothetical protein
MGRVCKYVLVCKLDAHKKPPFWYKNGSPKKTLVTHIVKNDPITHTLFFSYTQVSTTKGTGGDVIILEEAAYCDPGFFYETVAPLMLIGRTSLLAISTLTSEINFYSRLIKMKDSLTQVIANQSFNAWHLSNKDNRNPSSRRSAWSSHAKSARRTERPPTVSICYTSCHPGRALTSTFASRRSWRTGLTL